MSMSEPVNLLPRGWTESSRSPHEREGAQPCPASLSGAGVCPISEPEIVNVWRFLYLMPCLALLDFKSLARCQALSRARVVPVVSLDSSETAVPVARALVAGGINVMEIVLRTPAAEVRGWSW